MSSCSRSADILPYLMGELGEDDRVLFERHLEGCSACRDELRLERALQNGLIECTLFPEAYERFRGRVRTLGPYLAEGRVEEQYGAPTLNVERVVRVPSPLPGLSAGERIRGAPGGGRERW